MTLTITRPSALLATTGRELKALLGAVLPHISWEEDDLPALQGLHIEINGGDLRLIATDRFTMGIVRHPLTAVVDGFSCSIVAPGWAVRRFAERLQDDVSVSVRFEENRVVIEAGDDLDSIPAEASKLPWRTALGRVLDPADTPTGRFLVNPRFLARLAPAHALSEGDPMQFQMRGEHSAVIATLGTTFLALIMPISRRTVDDDQAPSRPLDVWFDLLDEETEGGR